MELPPTIEVNMLSQFSAADELVANRSSTVRRPGHTRERPRWHLAALAGALIAAGGLAAVAMTERPITVDVAPSHSDALAQVYGLGTAEGRVVSQIGFDVSGTLAELNVDQGDRVARGTVLARLDSESAEARVQQAQASVSQAKASSTEAIAGRARAGAIVAMDSRTNRRKQALVRSHVVSAQSAEEAQSAVEVALAEEQQAVAKIDVAHANLEQANATERLESDALRKHVLTAPYDALVVARRHELGTAIRAGDPLFTIMDPASFWILTYVDEARAGDIKLHDPATIRLRSLPGRTFHGDVVRIDMEDDRVSEERRVYVRCTDCDGKLYLGEQADAVITTGKLDHALLVPLTAIDARPDGTGIVWTLEHGRLARRLVQLGPRTLDGRTEVLGVPESAQIVAKLRPGLRDGRRATARVGAAP